EVSAALSVASGSVDVRFQIRSRPVSTSCDVAFVPKADSCTAANEGLRIEARLTSRLPRKSVRAVLLHTARTPGPRVDQPLPRQRDEFERPKDGLHLNIAAVVNRTSFGMISSCSSAMRPCPVPGRD